MNNDYKMNYYAFRTFQLKTAILFSIMFLIAIFNTNGQISGTKAIPSANYPTIKVAVDSLNLYGVAGGGGVTFNVAGGYTELLTARLNLTAAGTVADQIIFQISGVGANPKITSYAGANIAGTATSDGMWSLNGSDYITIDGIDLQEAAANITPTTQMEYGYGLFKASGTDGANNNTIKNCVITLNRNNTTGSSAGFGGGTSVIGGSIGIAVTLCSQGTETTLTTVTASSGASSNNKFYSNTIQNVNTGISMVGFAGASPFTLCDFNNDIGGASALTGNTILNFGGGTAPLSVCAAILIFNQWSLNFSFNTVNNNNGSGVNHTVTNRGIWTFANSNGASININNNNITIVGAAATYDMAIDFEMSQSGAVAGQVVNINSNTFSVTKTNVGSILQCVVYLNTAATTVNVNSNTVTNFTYPGTLTTDAGVIRSGLAGIGTLNINNNIIGGVNLTSTTGTNFIIGVTGSVTTALNITGNSINGVNTTGSTSKVLNLIQNTSAATTATSNINSNNFQNITHPGTGAINFIAVTGTPNFQTISNNTFTNLSIASTGTSTLISTTYSNTTGTGAKTISNNSIVTAFNRTGASGSLVLHTDNGSSVTGTITTVQNNNYSNITVAGTSTITGLNYTDGGTAPTKNFTGNILNNWTAGTGTVSCINITYLNGVSVLSNNTITNINTQGAITGITLGATINTATSVTVASNTINNLISTGTVGAVIGITCTNTSPVINFNNNTLNTFSSTGASAVTGISIGGATNTSVFKNKIYDLSGSNASSTVNGILVSAGVLVNVFNNLVGDLRAPNANAANPVVGLNFTGGTTINAYYNTVRLAASSTGALFGSSALSVSTTPAFTLRNNILVNLSSSVGATGFTSAYRRSSTTISTYSSLSNNNLLFAGTPGINNLIFYDGTNSDQTIAGFKVRVTPADLNSGTENPTFLSTVGASPNFLHIDPSVATNIESGAANISGITDDFDTQIRQGNGGYVGSGTAPDIGADEFGGIAAAALAAPITFGSNTPTTSSFNITWVDNSVGEAGFIVYRSINIGGPFTTIVGAITSTTPATTGTTYTLAQSGLLGGTTYYYQIVANNFTSSAPLAGNASTLTCGGGLAGTFSVGPTGIYSNLTGAIAALVTNGMSAPVILELQATYTSGSETFPITISNTIPCLNPTNTLTIRPETGVGSALLITSAHAIATIDINGGNFVTFDGRPGGSGTVSMLNIINTNAAGVAIRLINDASYNTITYCNVQGQNTVSVPTITLAAGVIFINSASATVLQGNDNNTISNCSIHGTGPAVANFPTIGIASFGTATSVNAYNDNCTITNCNIYDYFNATLASTGIKLDAGNTAWNISNNHFYQTTTLTYTAAVNHRALWVTPNVASIATAANGFTISGNYIGGNDATGAGMYTMTGAVAYVWMGMDLSVGLGTATSVQNNTITNINMTTSNTSSAAMLGISIANGNTNVGAITGNTIGSPLVNTAPYGITFTTTGSLGGIIGIRASAGGAHNISNNTIAGIELKGDALLVAPSFNGINYSGGTSCIINNDTVGSATLANSINLSSTSATSTSSNACRGIIANVSAANSTITNNLVANINSNYSGTGTTNTVVGIAVATGVGTVSGNTIRNLSSNSQGAGGGATAAMLGIAYTSTTAPAVISNNIIHTLKLTHPTTLAGITNQAIFYGGPTTGTANIVERNFIHSITIASPTNSSGVISGMDVGSGVLTIRNNMIRLGLDETGASIVSPCLVRGISKNVATSNIYFNSIYIGGTGVGSTATNTFALVRTGTAVDDWRNNILVNCRSNATTGGKHYAISLNSTATLTLNYNDYLACGTGGVFGFNGADVASYAPNWVTGDANSYSDDPKFVDPTGPASTVDLHINPSVATIIESTGINIASVTNDFDNQTRAALTPTDIGADAGNYISLVCNGTPPTSTAIISGNAGAICISGSKTLTLTNFSSIPGYTFQWQESTSLGGPYTNVTGGSGATATSFTTPIISQTMYYICVVTCSNGGLFTNSSEVAVLVNNPQVTNPVGATRCGTGTVTLCATPSAGASINWYSTPTGGSPITNPYSNVPLNAGSFNNDIVANGVGTNSIDGTTNPTIGVDGAQYSFIDNTFKYTSANALPTCFMPVNQLIPSNQTAGLTYQLQSYSANNAMSIANSATGYTSPLPNNGTLTLTTPASFGTLKVLYESVSNTPTTGFTVDAVVTFTDATTQTFSGNSCVNWFTPTAPAYSGMGRTTPAGVIQCGTTPNLFEMSLPINVSNYSKLVQSVTFSIPAVITGTFPYNINYFHALALGGNAAPTNCFTTPSISTTTTFYAAAITNGGSASNVGIPNKITPTSGAGTTDFGLVFNVLSAFTLNSVKVYPVSATNAAGTITIDVINGAGTVVNTVTVNVVGSPIASVVGQTVNLNFDLVPGNNYKLRPGSFTGITGIGFEPATCACTYPYTVPGVVSILTSTLTAAPTNTPRNDLYYYFYDWSISTGCASARTPVVATVTSPPALTITPNLSVCNNTYGTLAVTSTLGDYDSYTWSPATNLYSNTTGTAYIAGTNANTVYVLSTIGSTTIYTVTGTNSVSPFCSNTATTTVAIQPNATATATAAPNPSCIGTPVTLTASLGTPTTVDLGIDNNATKIGGNNGNLYRSGTTTNTEMRTQYLLTQAELLAAGIQAGPIASIGFYVLTGGGAGVFSNFTLRMGHTTATALTATFQTGPFTDVWFASTFTPQAGLNTHVFTTPFVWNGIDNVVIESCNTLTTGASGTTLQTFTTPTQTNMANLVAGGCSASAGGATGFTNCRPVISLFGNVSPTPSGFSWSDGNGVVGTTSPLTVSPSVNTNYTCTITANGCSFISNTILLTVTPLPSAPTASAPSTICGFGIPTVFVTSTTGASTPVFKWYSAATGGLLLQNSTSTTYTTSISTTTTFYVSEVNANGCESSPRTAVVQTVTPSDPLTITGGVSPICLGTTLNFGSTQTGSNQNYTLTWTASPAIGSGLPAGPLGPVQNWYTNDFTSGTGTGILSGNATLTGGVVQLTPNAISQAGALTIPNPANIAADALQVNFDLTLTQTGAEGADGLSYSFGDDVSATATVPNFENGTGTKLKVSFDSYGSAGAGQAGIYLMYNCNVANQTPTTSGVLAYIPNVSFVNTTTAVSITVTQAGLATVSLNGTPVISNIALPSGYLTSNRSTWQHVFKARTGAISQVHAIDNLVINYQNTVSTAVSGSTLSVTPTLPGTYTYTLTGIDGGCAFQTSQTVVVNPAAAAINAGPDLTTCSNTSVTLNASGSGLIPALRFTEVLWQVNAGTGPTGPSIPAWTSTWYTANGGTTMDMIEITNLGSGLAGSEGITIEMWNAASTTSGLPAYVYTIPAGAPVMNSGGLLYFTHSGATVVTDFTNNFYARGGTSIDNGSGTAAGMVMRKGSVIIDAVAVSGYTFPAASGVTASDWLGTLASNSGLSGTVLVAADNNTSSSWANTSASQLASIGTLNAGLVANLPSLGTVSWTSIPSGFTANTATATFGPLTATTSFIVQFNNGTCSSYDTVVVNVFAVIPTPLIATNLDTICASGTAALTVTNSIATATYQWSSSPSGLPGTFTNISGATGTTYTTPGLTLGSNDTTLYYQVSGTCGTTPSTSATKIIYVSNPRVSTTSNGTRCGLGTVNLAATPSAGAFLNWYANATGGAVLGSGNTFITPVINATTTFYVSSNTLSTEIAGKPAPTSTENIVGNQPLGVSFNVISKPATIKTVKIYSVGVAPGSLYVELWNSAGTVLNTAGPFTYGAGSTANPTVVTLPLDFIVPVGTNYRLVTTQMSGGSLIRETAANNVFPYVSASGNISVTGGYILSSGASATYYYLYNWQVQSVGCESARTAVVATVTPAPVVTLSPSSSICQGDNITLTATSINDPNYTYTWNPGGFVGASYNVNPSATTTYTATAVDNSGGANNSCQDIKTVTVTVNQRPSINSLSSSPSALCQGDSAQISLSTTPFIAPTFLGSYSMTNLSGQTYSSLSGGGITIINTAAQLTAGMGSGAQDDGGAVITLPFTFNYAGNPFTQMSMCTNGWVGAGNQGTIDATSMRTAANLFTSTIPNNTIAAWFKDMGANFPTGSGSMRHGLIGTDVYAFQWDNAVGSGFSDGSAILISFQVNIYGPASIKPGRIEIIYGPTVGTIATAASEGIEDAIGGTNHYINALTGTGNSTTTSSAWPGNGNGYRFDPVPASSLTYSWSPPAGLSSTSVQNPKAAPNSNTTYTVTVNESGTGCSRTATLAMNVSARPKPYLQEGDTVLCSNDPGFYIHVKDSGAYSGGYPGGTTFEFVGLTAPSNTDDSTFVSSSTTTQVIVTLPAYLGGCTTTTGLSNIDFGATQAAQIALSTDSVKCFGDATGDAIANIVFGGTGDYRWQWYDSGYNNLLRDVTTSSLTDSLKGVPQGMYIVVLTDHQGIPSGPHCSVTDSVYVGQPEAPLSVNENTGNHVNVLCNGALTGAIDIEVAGGTESYSYNWSNSAATEDLSGAGAGTYTCTVTDSRGCTAIISSTITQPAALALNATVNQIQCNGGTGSVLLNVTGGVTPYTVNWSNGNSTQSNTGLLSGTYTVTVTDVNGCTKSGTFTINTEPTVLSISCSSTNNNCFNSNNGTVSASASGGTTPYTYNWSNGSTSASQSNLPKGTYIVTFTDAHGCTASCLSTITQPAALAVTTVAVNPTSGSPASGTINVNVTGGTPAYSYQWNNGSTQQNRTGLSAGTYTVTVTDANGCSATKKVALTYTCQLGYVNTVVTKPSCGKANGVATVTGTGGTGYTYAWQTTPVQTTATGTGLLYYYNSYCLITDVTTGCSFMDTVTLPTSNGLLLTLTSPTYAGGKNIRCYGETNGSISLIVSGSTGPYTYLWNTGGTTQNLTGLGAGTYIVTVSNGGCTSSNLITLTQPAALLVATSGTNPSCGGSNGTATASASGGVAPYSYSWNTVPVKTGATATGLTAGVYTVTVSDANGCTKTAVVTLTTSGGLTITGIVTDAKCNGSSTGSIDITPSGGTAPYTYLWSTGATTQDRKNVLAAGTYTVTVTDKKGCAGQYSAIINEPTAITATSSSTNVSCYGGSNGSASVTPTGGTPGYTYSWNTTPAKTGSGVTGLKAGTFIAIITDSKSCMKAVSVTITQPSSIVISISKTNVTAFGGSNGTATANVSGGVSPYGYSWNTVPVKSTQTATGLSAGTYTVTVTDANGCTKTKSVTITQPTARLADNTNSNNAINSVVYPNPTTGKFSVSFDETIRTDVNLQVFSMTGERVFMSDISVNENASSFDMDLSRLTKGIYFIRYRTNDKDWMEKLVIQ